MGCVVEEQEILNENTVIFGEKFQRKEMFDKPYVSIQIFTSKITKKH